MPSVYSQLVDQGVLFKRAYVNTSLCCPSRAQIVSGLYEHDTGVDQNEVMLRRPTFPMALHDAGYPTMLAGKYMNSWPCDPRGEFDEWACVATPEISSLSLVDPMVNIDGVWQRKTGYEPDVLEDLASSFIKDTPDDQPFFVMYTPTTPHLPADDPRYADMPVSPPRGPEFDANTMTTATPPYSRRPPLTKEEIATSDEHYSAMAHATRSFDDSVGRLLASLGDRAQNTLVIYLSDNGFLYGEHRRTGKNDPWEESVKVPMVVRYPAALPATRSFASDALVQNVDMAPTILDAAGIPWGGDGQSFLPVIERKARTVRTAALIEQCRGESRGIPDCSGYNFNGARAMTPGFQGVITDRYKYVEFEDGSRQLIDLQKDPHEFHDLSRNPAYAGVKRQMVAKLHTLMRPRLQTTIATGPSGPSASRVAEFSYFSPSRFATYRCRLAANGKNAVWRSCPGGFVAYNDLADGRYRFEVAGIDESGRIDRTPASRVFTVSSTGPEVDVGCPIPAAVHDHRRRVVHVQRRDRLEHPMPPRLGRCDRPRGRRATRRARRSPASGKAGTASTSGRATPLMRSATRPADGSSGSTRPGPTVAFSSSPLANTRSDSASFRFEAPELIKGPMTCTLDSKAIGCSNGRVSLPRCRRAIHSLAVKATDVAGNVGTTTFAWMVDRSSVRTSGSSRPGKVSNDPVSAFNLWSSEGPGFFGCSLDGGVSMPCFGAPNFSGLKEGRPHPEGVVGRPGVQHVVPVRYVWKIDRTAPVLSLLGGPAEGSSSGRARSRSASRRARRASSGARSTVWSSPSARRPSTTRSSRAASTRSRSTRSTRPEPVGHVSAVGRRPDRSLLELPRSRVAPHRRAIVRIAPGHQELDRRPNDLGARVEPERQHDQHDHARDQQRCHRHVRDGEHQHDDEQGHPHAHRDQEVDRHGPEEPALLAFETQIAVAGIGRPVGTTTGRCAARRSGDIVCAARGAGPRSCRPPPQRFGLRTLLGSKPQPTRTT